MSTESRGPGTVTVCVLRGSTPSSNPQLFSVNRPVRVLVVEDSVVQRKILRDALEGVAEIEVVGHASNGQLALDRIRAGGVDVLTLDLEMPVMGGLEVLEKLGAQGAAVGAIVVSALSQQGAQQTLEAMRLGAFDLITKPSSSESLEQVVLNLRRELVPRILACGDFLKHKHASAASAKPSVEPRAPLPSPTTSVPARATSSPTTTKIPELIVLGSSTGGPQALDKVLPALSGDLPIPLLLVQHMPPMFTRTMAESLDRKCALRVSEAEHGKIVEAGEIVIAPGGQQMKFRKELDGRLRILITDDPPERSCKPAVDYLFRCASEVYGERTLGVILTGMGDDGTAGIRLLREKGARVIAQDEASCVVFGMPRIPVLEGLADTVLPLDRIAGEIQSRCMRGVRS
jgi:two-component system chemotaxis response regulator CheB